MRYFVGVTVLVLLVGGAVWAERTGSFWDDAKVSQTSAILTVRQPNRVFHKEDIITIIVTEVSKASGAGDLERERDFEHDFAINSWMRLVNKGGGSFTLRPALSDDGTTIKPKLDFEGGMKDAFSGAIKRQYKMEARIAAIVRDVKPNGNLVIEATRMVELNKEKVNITLSGVVRAEDVRADNTVPSYNVAMADIKYKTNGPASDGAKRGWLTRIIDLVRPF